MEDLKNPEFLNKLISVVPTKNQIDIQKMGYYNFIHFGLNTFTGQEWGDGTVSPKKFGIKNAIDTDLWCRQLKSTGSKGVIVTAKHHDGFCLFPSKYTDYTIAATDYCGGKGDIILQMAESCKKEGIKLGIYLSPWDRHDATYGTEEYNDFYCNQLTELCTNYGELFCIWFDGACGEGANGKVQRYDWERYYALIKKLQPNACISNCGSDVRWIGNEFGHARESEWSVVPKRLQCYDKISKESQQENGAYAMLKKIDNTDKTLGEKWQLINEPELCWWPAEMDIPVTYVGWFYHKTFEIFCTRSVKNLVQCYNESVGNNAMLLCNVPPNKKGQLPKKFIKRLVEAKEKIQGQFKNLVSDKFEKDGDTLIFKLGKNKVSKVILGEDISKSHRIEKFEILIDGQAVFSGGAVGYKKFCFFKPTAGQVLKIVVTDKRGELFITTAEVYQ